MQHPIRTVIQGVAGYVPEEILDNAKLETMVDTTDEWIVKRTGIKERRILKNHPTSYIGVESTKKLLQKTGISPRDIDLFVCGTNTPDMPFPSTAGKIAKEVGAPHAIAFDVQAACPAFLYALTIANQFIRTGTYKNILVCGIDKMSSVVNYTDRRSCILFGDGGGCVLLTGNKTKGTGILDTLLFGNTKGGEHLYISAGGSLNPASTETIKRSMHYVYQNGPVVFKEATTCMKNACLDILQRNHVSLEEIDWIIPHQANLRIIELLRKELQIPIEKVIINIHKYGNTSAGTIPLCLAEYESRFKKGDKILLTSFGAGFSWSAVYLIWDYNS